MVAGWCLAPGARALVSICSERLEYDIARTFCGRAPDLRWLWLSFVYRKATARPPVRRDHAAMIPIHAGQRFQYLVSRNTWKRRRKSQ